MKRIREKGMDYVWEKKSLFYKDCLTLGPKYKVDKEFSYRIIGAIKKKVVGLYKEHLQSDPKYKTKIGDDLENETNDEVT